LGVLGKKNLERFLWGLRGARRILVAKPIGEGGLCFEKGGRLHTKGGHKGGQTRVPISPEGGGDRGEKPSPPHQKRGGEFLKPETRRFSRKKGFPSQRRDGGREKFEREKGGGTTKREEKH